jgi:hypothetical protein
MNKRKLVTDRRPGWQGPYGAVDMNVEDETKMHYRDQINRVEMYIIMQPIGQKFSRGDIFNYCNKGCAATEVFYNTIDEVIEHKIFNGEIFASALEKHVYYKTKNKEVKEKSLDVALKERMESIDSITKKILAKIDQMPDKPKNGIEKRISDLEIKYKWLEECVAKIYLKDDPIFGTQKPLTPKKKRLWSANNPIPRNLEYIDIMFEDGKIVEKFYIGKAPLMESGVVCWRESE